MNNMTSLHLKKLQDHVRFLEGWRFSARRRVIKNPALQHIDALLFDAYFGHGAELPEALHAHRTLVANKGILTQTAIPDELPVLLSCIDAANYYRGSFSFLWLSTYYDIVAL